uniref:Endonuclease/exonuclease/phosphatase domain-containing protein n=1 Tax=Naja naja TaxID=35670 RepID=A0A8C7DZX1_NAJNA
LNRKQILSKLVKQNIDIVCLQEVHIKNQDKKYLEFNKLGKLHAKQSKCTDIKGRILILEIKIGQRQILLVNIYASKKNQKEFYKKLHERIVETGQKDICIVGDYNGIIETTKDYICDNKKMKKRNILPQTFFDMTEELNLIDVWRTLNPMEKQSKNRSQIRPRGHMAYQKNIKN